MIEFLRGVLLGWVGVPMIAIVLAAWWLAGWRTGLAAALFGAAVLWIGWWTPWPEFAAICVLLLVSDWLFRREAVRRAR